MEGVRGLAVRGPGVTNGLGNRLIAGYSRATTGLLEGNNISPHTWVPQSGGRQKGSPKMRV